MLVNYYALDNLLFTKQETKAFSIGRIWVCPPNTVFRTML